MALHRIGGHFPGSAVAHFVAADGRGVLLSGDTVAGTPDEHWVSFMRSFPKQVPLSAAVVAKVADRVMAIDSTGDTTTSAARSLATPLMGAPICRPLRRLGSGDSITSPGNRRGPALLAKVVMNHVRHADAT